MRVDPERFVQVMRLAVEQAGSVAFHLQGKVRKERKQGSGTPESSALTAVDLATQDVILRLLHRELPTVSLDAEEDTPAVSWFAPPDADAPLVVIDPVDGTLNYTLGSPDYAVMAALLQDGRYQASVIRFPVADVTYWAVRGAGCFCQEGRERAVRVQQPRPAERILFTPKTGKAQRESLAQAVGLPLERSRCSAVDASAPAIGRARGSISRDRADRRRAIGFLLATEIGGAVYFGSRRWQGEDPATLSLDACPSICADTDALAQALLKGWRSA